MTRIVIVGAGQAGLQLAASLRDAAFTDRITLIGDEGHAPYQRPPLSKSFLNGEVGIDDLMLEGADFFAKSDIDFVSSDPVMALHRAPREVELRSGARIGYDHLVLATGARNRRVPGLDAPVTGIHSLRTIADAESLRGQLASARDAVIVGAGFLGLEVAALAAARSLSVHVVEATDRPMERAISPQMSALFRQRHEAAGVAFSFASLVVEILHDDARVTGVRLADGRQLPADLVLISIGVMPNDELATQAGLDVSNGVVVDECLRTTDRAISAIGDCAAFPDAGNGGAPIRLECVQNADDQARYLARQLAGEGDATTPYRQTPIFWSEQAGLRLQIAGAAQRSDDSILRGDPASGQLSVFRYRRGVLVAVESANRPADHMAARKLLARGNSPAPQQAADTAFDLRAFANAPAATPA